MDIVQLLSNLILYFTLILDKGVILMAIVHLGPACVKTFIEKLSGTYPTEINVTDIVKEVLEDNKRWCVMMGRVAIQNELKDFEHACSEAGVEMQEPKCHCNKTNLEAERWLSDFLEDYAHKKLISSKHKFHDEEQGKTFLGELKKGGNKVIDLLNDISEKDEWIKPFFRKLVPPSKSPQLSGSADKLNYILSTGAGGFKFSAYTAFTKDKKKDSLYKIVYPAFKINNSDQEEALLQQMIKAKVVPNSLFFFAGSAKQYKSRLKDITKK